VRTTINRRQAGDTIVEVLVALLVVGIALVAAYGISSRSLRASRSAQERGEALKLVEGQVEKLKGIAVSDNTQGIFDGGETFCIADNNSKVTFDASYDDFNNLSSDTLTQYPNAPEAPGTQCVKDNLYNISVQEISDNEFALQARWFSLNDQDKEEVRIKYRMYSR